MPHVHVGLDRLVGKLSSYAERFDLLEVGGGDAIPKLKTLRGWRDEVPPSFAFVTVFSEGVGSLADGADLQASIRETLRAADALGARAALLRTPSSVRPSTANKKRLAELAPTLASEGRLLLWEPSGLWEPEDAMLVAKEMGAQLVLDATQDDPIAGPIVYTRLRGLGLASSLGPKTVQRLAGQLEGRREAFVVLGDKGHASRLKGQLADWLGGKPPPAGGWVIRPSHRMAAEDEEQ